MQDEYKAPTFEAIKNRLFQDFSGFFAMLRLAFSVALAKAFHLLHIHIEWVDKQNSPLRCGVNRLYDWALVYEVPRLDATFATGNILVTGNIGAFALLDETLRGDNGLDYKITSAVELTAGDNLVPVRCLTAGLAGNLGLDSVLTFIEPQPGVDSEARVSANGLTGGEEQEAVEPWRARVVDEWQTVVVSGGRSGKPADYVAWSKKAHPSVTGALVFRGALGLGTILVKPICNGLEGRLPTEAVLNAVKAKILELAPGTADWSAAAPGQHFIEVSLALNPLVDTLQNRELISASLNNLVLSENSENSVLGQAELAAAVAAVTTQYTDLTPNTDTTVNEGSVFVLISVVFA